MKKIIFTALCIIVILTGISIEKQKENYTKVNKVKFITYNMSINPENLNLTTNNNIREKDLLVTLFEGLVKENEEGKVMPALADEVLVSDDGLEYTFKLRNDIYYSTGEKITAEEFKNFFKAFLSDPDNIYSSRLDCIFGAKEFREGRGEFSNVAVSTKEENILSIRLNYSVPNFINTLSNPVFNLRDYGSLDNYKENYSTIRYTGPFGIEQASNNEIILKKNENYYDKAEVASENLKITFLESVENSLAIFENNDEVNTENNLEDIDIMMDAPINELFRLSQESKIEGFHGSSKYYLNFNNTKESFGRNINFKKAVNLLLAKEYYSQLICKELLTPATSYVTYDDETQKVFSTYGDTEKAKAYFKESGINEGATIRIVYEKGDLSKRIAEDLGRDIKEYMKVDVQCEEFSQEAYENHAENKSYDIMLQRFYFNDKDPMEFYEKFGKDSSFNKIKYNDEVYENLIEEARHETDQQKLNNIYVQCEEILKTNLVSIPVYRVNNAVCVKSNIKGVYTTVDGNIKLNKVKEVP